MQKRLVLVCEDSLCPRKQPDVNRPGLGEAGRYNSLPAPRRTSTWKGGSGGSCQTATHCTAPRRPCWHSILTKYLHDFIWFSIEYEHQLCLSLTIFIDNCVFCNIVLVLCYTLNLQVLGPNYEDLSPAHLRNTKAQEEL